MQQTMSYNVFLIGRLVSEKTALVVSMVHVFFLFVLVLVMFRSLLEADVLYGSLFLEKKLIHEDEFSHKQEIVVLSY